MAHNTHTSILAVVVAVELGASVSDVSKDDVNINGRAKQTALINFHLGTLTESKVELYARQQNC